MVATNSGKDPSDAASAAARSARPLLSAFVLLLAGFALLLAIASLVGGRLAQPLDRIPVATYAARQGIALPPDPTMPPSTRVVAHDGPATAIATVPRTATPGVAMTAPRVPVGVDPALVAVVHEAYLRAWEVWAEACLMLDSTLLEAAFASPELDRARSYVRQLRASGRALRLDAAHRVTVLEIDGDTALVLDELTDRSLYIDPATRMLLPPGAQPTPTGTERLQCRLRRTETGWRVIDMTWNR